MNREGDNVRQTDANRKNARQQHPPKTVPPSKSPTQPTIPDRSALPIQDTSNHSALHRQKCPPNPGKTDEKQALPVNPEGDSVAGGRICSNREGDNEPGG